jgi:hypothetical protein
MKILLLDVDSCYFCPCSSAEVGWLGDITRSLCQAKGKENTVYMDGVSGVPEWCPLKPMPKPKGYINAIEWHLTEKDSAMFISGWNACLKEIEK